MDEKLPSERTPIIAEDEIEDVDDESDEVKFEILVSHINYGISTSDTYSRLNHEYSMVIDIIFHYTIITY